MVDTGGDAGVARLHRHVRRSRQAHSRATSLAEGVNLGDYQVLVYLSEAPDRSMRMCDLAEHLQLSPSGLTRRLDGLVKSGAVVRQGSESDRRVMMAVLTDVGFATLERVAPFHVASVRRRIFDQLDAAQVSALESIFTAINAGLHADPACAAARLATLAAGHLTARASVLDTKPTMVQLPQGFRSYVANIGVKDDTDDLVVVAADAPVAAAALFTPQPVRRSERDAVAPHTSPTGRPGRRRDLEERQRRDRASRATTTLERWPNSSRIGSAARSTTCRDVDRRDRAARTRWIGFAPGSARSRRRCRAPMPTDRRSG